MEEIESSGVPLLTIEWDMMNKTKFFGLSAIHSITLRFFLYPLTVIKTRLQLQKTGQEVYKGTIHAFRQIVQNEGFFGLYKGFWVNTMQVVSGFGYIITYEKARHILSKNNINDNRVRGLIAGGLGSLVSQTIICPFDVISQHLMLWNKSTRARKLSQSAASSKPYHLNIDPEMVRRYGLSRSVVKELYRCDGGLRAYYRGYLSSVATYVPNSALWWMFYPVYSEKLVNNLPSNTSHMLIHCSAGSLSGMTVATLTNALDVMRANIQVRRIKSIVVAAQTLWSEERSNIFIKGLSARLVHSGLSSTFIAAGYETLKRLSLHDEFRDSVRW
ncbi:Solute carrier family 25 member 44 [Sarcoptes scabiei]|uniref:Solute carrier family 25 member 44 n=1 Tax=Sarcoptes scabiei TaxID=52283 RepID=A0A834RB60_SARSC|nr:Solute carrier family 25 member 44 [Sarcoptes scabiei]